jgi:hypothetical protein
MKSDKRIESEIMALKKALANPKRRWNNKARDTINQTITVLHLRMTPAQVEQKYYQDETSSEFQEWDNELYHEMVRVSEWLHNGVGNAPSAGL